MKTTLNAIRGHGPCRPGWTKLLAHLGKTQADDEPLPILTILKFNGLDDALWALRAVGGHDREIRLYAVWCARQVQHLMKDKRSLDALDVAERFANGTAYEWELTYARAAAGSAAGSAAGFAAEAAAGAAARAAAGSVAGYVAGAAAGSAAGSAAWAAARSAAESAAGSAAGYVAGAAAWAAAEAAARTAQKQKLIEMCGGLV